MGLKVITYNDTNEHETTVWWVGEVIDGQGKCVYRSERYTDLDKLEDIMEMMKLTIEKETNNA